MRVQRADLMMRSRCRQRCFSRPVMKWCSPRSSMSSIAAHHRHRCWSPTDSPNAASAHACKASWSIWPHRHAHRCLAEWSCRTWRRAWRTPGTAAGTSRSRCACSSAHARSTTAISPPVGVRSPTINKPPNAGGTACTHTLVQVHSPRVMHLHRRCTRHRHWRLPPHRSRCTAPHLRPVPWPHDLPPLLVPRTAPRPECRPISAADPLTPNASRSPAAPLDEHL